MKSSISDRIKRALKLWFPAPGGAGAPSISWNRTLPGSQYDYRREVGNLWENSVVYALLSWQANQFAQAPLVVEEPGGKPGRYSVVTDHPLTKLIKRPNPHWSCNDMWGATLLSMAVGGSAYWVKVRSSARKVVEVWWVPHWMMTPIWPADGSLFISAFRYRVDGRFYDYATSEVVHFKNGLVNPFNQRTGLGSFSGSLREICTENEAGTYESAMLRNRGIPGVILSPKEGADPVTKEQAETVKRLWADEFAGDGAGKLFLSNLPLDVTIPQFEPDKMSLTSTRGEAVSRICAGFGIDPMVIGLSSDQRVFSNYEEANRAGWEHNILPAQGLVAETLDCQLLPDFDTSDTRQVGFNNSRVPALQGKRDDLYHRISMAVGGPWMTPDEGRAETGRDKVSGGSQLRRKRPAANRPTARESRLTLR